MQFLQTQLSGVWLIEAEPARDHRGFFARTFCTDEFARHGLVASFVQHSISHSSRRGTLRGMHFQIEPHAEVKVVSCLKGGIWDVVIDLRPESPGFGKHLGVELTAENRRQLYIPKGFAHGFITLADDTDVGYLISQFYEPLAARGVRYNDPRFAIAWPLAPAVVSDKDMTWPDFAGSAKQDGTRLPA